MKLRALFGVTAVALAAATVTMPALPASADTTAVAARSAMQTPPPNPPVGAADGNVSATALSSWQTDNTVWAVAYGNGVVYVGGQFTNVRPPGEPARPPAKSGAPSSRPSTPLPAR